MVAVADDERAGARLRPEHVVDEPVPVEELLGLQSDSTSLTCPQRGPRIPRCATRKPAAFATSVASIDSFVPSANDVIIFGPWPTESANARWVSGFRCGSMNPLMFPTSTGRRPIVRTYRRRFMIDARLVAVRVREHRPPRRPP